MPIKLSSLGSACDRQKIDYLSPSRLPGLLIWGSGLQHSGRQWNLKSHSWSYLFKLPVPRLPQASSSQDIHVRKLQTNRWSETGMCMYRGGFCKGRDHLLCCLQGKGLASVTTFSWPWAVLKAEEKEELLWKMFWFSHLFVTEKGKSPWVVHLVWSDSTKSSSPPQETTSNTSKVNPCTFRCSDQGSHCHFIHLGRWPLRCNPYKGSGTFKNDS